MKIIFFGASHGVPEPNRKCSSVLLEVGESRYFIDMGTQSVEELITRQIPLSSVRCVFVTHLHGDHTNGLISFLDLCSWKFKDTDPKIFLPHDLEAAKAALTAWLQCNGTTLRPFSFLPVKEGLLYEDEKISVFAFQTKHTASSYAFLVEAEGKRVLFSGDLCTKGPDKDFPLSVFEKPLDLAICEVAHFPATDYLPLLAEEKKLKMLCFNHYADRHMASICAYREKVSAYPILLATDGMEIDLS